nr:hypothetical protein [uncultured bacterium]
MCQQCAGMVGPSSVNKRPSRVIVGRSCPQTIHTSPATRPHAAAFVSWCPAGPWKGHKARRRAASPAARAIGPVSVGKALEAPQRSEEGRDWRPWSPGSMRSTT